MGYVQVEAACTGCPGKCEQAEERCAQTRTGDQQHGGDGVHETAYTSQRAGTENSELAGLLL